MNESKSTLPPIALLGGIEPHAQLMSLPPENQLLYKVMTVENLLRSIANNYLHFNRVDSYSDFANADENDGQQLPTDQPFNAASKFQKAPKFSAANYYDKCRSRTYACSFSTVNSAYIWKNYGNGSEKGKVCIVFDFAKLRAMLNSTLNPEGVALLYEGNLCHQIFSINYGLVNYVPWATYQANVKHLPNPILYTYLKDRDSFQEEQELRIALSAIGIGHFALQDGSLIEFPKSLQFGFNFHNAFAANAIKDILLSPNSDSSFLMGELSKLRIEPAPSTEKK